MLKLCKQETWIVYLAVSCIWISYKRALAVFCRKYAKKKIKITCLPKLLYLLACMMQLSISRHISHLLQHKKNGVQKQICYAWRSRRAKVSQEHQCVIVAGTGSAACPCNIEVPVPSTSGKQGRGSLNELLQKRALCQSLCAGHFESRFGWLPLSSEHSQVKLPTQSRAGVGRNRWRIPHYRNHPCSSVRGHKCGTISGTLWMVLQSCAAHENMTVHGLYWTHQHCRLVLQLFCTSSSIAC